MSIDEHALVHPDARLGQDVTVGPFSVIGPNVSIGAGTRIGSHTIIEGHTTIGCNNRIHQFVSLGSEPQHNGYQGEPTQLIIGDNNTFREYASVHRGTLFDEGVTRIGNDNLLMAYTHVAHDCRLGNGITMVNSASLAGHVHIGDHCVMAGFALVYQFRHVGPYAYVAYCSGVVQDVPAFVKAAESPAKPHGVNSVGMRRQGFAQEDIAAVKKAYQTLYRSKLRLEEAKAAIREQEPDSPALAILLASLDNGQRGIIR